MKLPTPLPVIAMVVVGAAYFHVLNAQNLRDVSPARRLPRPTVSDNSQDDRTPGLYNVRTLNSYRWYSHNVLQTPCAARPWLVTRGEYHLFWYAQLHIVVTRMPAIHHFRWPPNRHCKQKADGAGSSKKSAHLHGLVYPMIK